LLVNLELLPHWALLKTSELHSEAWEFEHRTPGKDVGMLESTIALLGGLCLSALTLLMGACIAGSIVAALRAVSRESTIVSTKK
jgi:hypothetical protein